VGERRASEPQTPGQGWPGWTSSGAGKRSDEVFSAERAQMNLLRPGGNSQGEGVQPFTPHPILLPSRGEGTQIDALDRRIIVATQEGLPRVRRPYHAIAEQLGISAGEVMARLQRMLESGVIRRIGAVPNHYLLGYKANGMSVWDVPEERIRELGQKIGELDFVSHCYHRPRHLPDWPYNLFAMVHGRDRPEVEAKVAQIAALLGAADRGHAVLYSTRILKKTGLRIS
jgi:DNA-binding Lrp family transcriptional regulator